MANKVIGFNERDAHNLIRIIGGTPGAQIEEVPLNQTSINLYVFQLVNPFQPRFFLGRQVLEADADVWFPQIGVQGAGKFRVRLTDVCSIFGSMIANSLGLCLQVHDIFVPIQGSCPVDTTIDT